MVWPPRISLLLQQAATLYDAGSLLLAFLPYLISFLARSNSNSDVNMQLIYPLEFIELFFNDLRPCANNNHHLPLLYSELFSSHNITSSTSLR